MGIAIVVHLVIALSVGGYVVYEGIVPTPFFESNFSDATPSEMMEEMPTLIEEEPLPQVQTVETQVVQEEGGADAPDMSDLITVSNASIAPTFSMPTAAGNPGLISGSMLGGSGSGKGTGIGKGIIKLGSAFGSTGLGSGVLTGYFYDFKQDADGNQNEVGAGYVSGGTVERNQVFREALSEFLNRWDRGVLSQYFRAGDPLQTTQILILGMNAGEAPTAFDVQDQVQPSGWAILYTGNITAPEDGRYRFVGLADDMIMARVDGKVVFDGNWRTPVYNDVQGERIQTAFGSERSGEWFTLREGDKVPIEIILCEVPGGTFYARLFIQEKGVEYERGPDGGLKLPPFQMMPTELPAGFGGKVMEEPPTFGAE